MEPLNEKFRKFCGYLKSASKNSGELSLQLKPDIFKKVELSVSDLNVRLSQLIYRIDKSGEKAGLSQEKISQFGDNISIVERNTKKCIDEALNNVVIVFYDVNKSVKDSETGFGELITLFANLTTTGIGLNSLIRVLGSSAIGAFGSGGTVTLAITGGIALLILFMQELNKAQREAQKIDFINKEKSNNTYWGLMKPGSISKEQIDALKRKSEIDPYGLINSDGKAITNTEFYRQKEKQYLEQNTLPAPPGLILNSEEQSFNINKKSEKSRFPKLSTSYSDGENDIKLLNTRQQILQEIEEIEKKIAIEDLPLQKKEFEKQIEALQFRIRLLSGEFEKINLEGLEPKKLPEENTEITPRSVTTSGKKKKDNKESFFFLKAQLGLIKSFEEAIPNLQNSFQGLFAAFVPPQGAADPFRDFMKEVVLTFLNAVELMMYEAGAASFFKAILTGSLSLTKDIGLMAAGMAALQIAKGFIGGFAKGTDYLQKSGYALVGEQGPELVYLNRGAKVFNNNDTSKMLNSARGNMQANMNVNNVYISSSLDALTFFRVNYPKYKKFKRLQSN